MCGVRARTVLAGRIVGGDELFQLEVLGSVGGAPGVSRGFAGPMGPGVGGPAGTPPPPKRQPFIYIFNFLPRNPCKPANK